MTDDLKEVTLSGVDYTDVTLSGAAEEYSKGGEYSFIFVTDGLAFGETRAVKGGYYVSLPPTSLPQLADHDGVETERTLYEANGLLYIRDVRDEVHVSTTPDYYLDGTLRSAEDFVSSITYESKDGFYHTDTDTVYVRFESAKTHVDDLVIPREQVQSGIESGDIIQLWPIWQSGHR